mmetsp:Transcript_97943/g.277041  ORF Transcript_97943/g.277041 Transcript_97943/m.277041 type:complete len:166 (-) Transcript_97943:167-664(-)
MSSWQQAISDDIRKGKKRDSIVVLNGNQQKNLRTGREDSDVQNWICAVCAYDNLGSYYRCKGCNRLRTDQRAQRLEMRAKEGEIGKGGGFFQRISTEDRKNWNSDDEDYDEFGRKKKRTKDASPRKGSHAGKKAMSEKQREALARLHQKAKNSKASRSRSRSSRK